MTREEILYEQQLIRRCQAGDEAAWFELFERYQQCTWRIVRRCLGDERHNEELIEELVAQVWASLGYNHGKRLLGYDPERTRFATFLASRTWQVVQQDRDKRWHRRRNEVSRDFQDWEPVDLGVMAEVLNRRLEEFLATRPAWEVALCRTLLTDSPAAGELPAVSKKCFQKRVERLRWKLKAFLEQ